MKITGDFKTTSIDDLFKTLSEREATGTLYISSSFGEKQITLSNGSILLLTDQLAQRVRIGDLLVGRGKLKEPELMEALKLQKENRGRMRIGAILVSRNFVSKADVDECLRFQLEEEICDLYTWNDATFEFEEGAEAETFDNAGASSAKDSGSFLCHLPVEPKVILEEASKRADEIQEVAHRLSSPYMCFTVTDVALNRFDDLTPLTQALIKLVQQGRTLETIVKRSYQGRLSIYKTIIRMLDDGWVLPYPSSKLKFLASEHRARVRYGDALHIYRRLLESSTDMSESLELKRLISEVTKAILKARDAGERPEGLDAIRYKDAAQRFVKHRRIKRIIFGGLIAAGVAYGVFFYINQDQKKGPSSNYLAASYDTEQAIGKGNYEEAVKIWATFLESRPNKEDELGKVIRSKLERLRRMYETHVQIQIDHIKQLEKNGKFDEAKNRYAELLKKFPKSILKPEILKAQTDLQNKRARIVHDAGQSLLEKELASALEKEKRKSYARARTELNTLKSKLPPESKFIEKIDQALQRLRLISNKAESHYQAGLAFIEKKKNEDAISEFGAVGTAWPELEATQHARKRLSVLQMQRSLLRELTASARAAEARGATSDALQFYDRIEREFSGFRDSRVAQEKIKKLSASLGNAEKLLAQAVAAKGNNQWAQARTIYSALLRSHHSFLVSKKTNIPIKVVSIPAGASVTFNGKLQGKTPLFISIPVNGNHEISILKPGFTEVKRSFRKIQSSHLDLMSRLQRAIVRSVSLPGKLSAAPYVDKNCIVLPIATQLLCMKAGADGKIWETAPLVDASVTYRPSSDGTTKRPFVTDRAWWNLQVTPQRAGNKYLVLPTRAGKIFQIDYAKGKHQELIAAPLEIPGRLFVDDSALLAGTSLVAYVTEDGTVRVYDQKSKSEKWHKKIAEGSYPGCAPVTGVMKGSMGTLLVVSRGGLLRCLTLLKGDERWRLDIKKKLKRIGRIDYGVKSVTERLCAFLTEGGQTILIDLITGKKIWTLDPSRSGDWAESASVGSSGIYILTRSGKLQRYTKNAIGLKPAEPTWERVLDDFGLSPLIIGKYIFVATRTGNVTAVSAADGKIIWKYSCSSRPEYIESDGSYLYVATADGKLTVLEVELSGNK